VDNVTGKQKTTWRVSGTTISKISKHGSKMSSEKSRSILACDVAARPPI
jgi:hypothetical protein